MIAKQGRRKQLLLGKAEAYERAISCDPRAAASEMALWADPRILCDYALFAREHGRSLLGLLQLLRGSSTRPHDR